MPPMRTVWQYKMLVIELLIFNDSNRQCPDSAYNAHYKANNHDYNANPKYIDLREREHF